MAPAPLRKLRAPAESIHRALIFGATTYEVLTNGATIHGAPVQQARVQRAQTQRLRVKQLQTQRLQAQQLQVRLQMKSWGWFALLLLGGAAAGCHRNSPVASAPPPPAIPTAPNSAQGSGRDTAHPYPGKPLSTASSPVAITPEDERFVAAHQPIYTETGVASWYGPPYHNRRGANGQIFDQNALTAAHRTLPMNSLVQVTNLVTGQAAIVRVTDRGPFVQGRLLDLSVASAKAVGVWLPGLARVRVDVYQTPAAIADGGRWCVQVGAFKDGGEALKLRDRMLRKYHAANVIEFTGPTGHWVRIRPDGDDKGRAVEIARELRPTQGDAYLVRLD